MRKIELVADGTVVSYMFRRRALGNAYSQLIGDCQTGLTLLAVSESRQGVVYGNWSDQELRPLMRSDQIGEASMSAARRSSSALTASEMRVAVLGQRRVSMTEKPSEKEEQDRQLRKEYERLLRQLDRKPAGAAREMRSTLKDH